MPSAPPSPRAAPSPVEAFAVVVPAHNEAENVGPLIEEIFAGTAAFPPREVIFVDDGSSDATAAEVLKAAGRHPEVVLVRHNGRFGQSAGVRSGAEAATAPWIVTLDGDGQNDPADIPALIAEVEGAVAAGRPLPALVAGLRRKRRDTLSKRLASRFANGLRSRLLGDNCPDTGCGLKLIRRDVLLGLPYFNALHRFLPALVQIHGWPMAMAPVNHRPRERGTTKYTNWQRGLVGLFDLFGVLWLKKRTRRPEPGRITVERAEPAAADRMTGAQTR
ncbi:dolichol-phosphate mannosyltransferase [Tistlia consotensis]|uniref:Dolichol-phosphate mannosyltransferase n=1 Tax=Tistlia consotensis USBA 355 TaxID=560819 RepID=A0A1Y6BKW8_9PROT|nr:glycosyltransferase family 2 protein [Tistlia consotensis]SMF14453.1 dolichol-phosphate mannosyltransferase [Tistlia consotensis USBA 355]SNR49518.1 dolichol-phosphate mannosyltransferase [Tistlia consotensis]